MKILLSSKEWLPMNCQPFLLHWGKADLSSNLSLVDDIMKKDILNLKGHRWDWSSFKENRVQDESEPGTFTWVSWGKTSFNLPDNNGKKSQSHFLDLMREWHEGANKFLPFLYCLIGRHICLETLKSNLAIDIWPHQKTIIWIAYSGMRVKLGKSTRFIVLQWVGAQLRK